MGCCESRHDPSLGGGGGDPFGKDGGGGSYASVECAAAAIRAAAEGAAPPSGLRDVRLSLLALPRDAASVPEIRAADMLGMVQVLNGEVDNADVMLTGLVLMRYLAQVSEIDTSVYPCMYIHTYMHTYIHTCMHACMHACMYIHTYMHTHIHT